MVAITNFYKNAYTHASECFGETCSLSARIGGREFGSDGCWKVINEVHVSLFGVKCIKPTGIDLRREMRRGKHLKGKETGRFKPKNLAFAFLGNVSEKKLIGHLGQLYRRITY